MRMNSGADEFSLFYRALATKSMHLKGQKCSVGKNSKIRLTGLAAANMCGEKIPLFIIGKLKKPPCFQGNRRTPCHYHLQKKSLNYLIGGSENRAESLR